MSKKKIEPTDAMVTSAHSAAVGRLMTDPMTYRQILRTALNHPDASGLFADEDDRLWEPLGEDAPLSVGDEVRQEMNGVTTIAVVGSVDKDGDPWTTEDRLIGVLDLGTWYVRRAVQELPTEDGAVIVPAEGHEFIEQVGDCANYRRLTYDAASGRWIGWDTLNHEADALLPRHITPGTWKVEGE